MSAKQGSEAGGPSRRGLLKAGLAAGAIAGTGAWGSSGASSARRHERLRQPGSLPYPRLPAGTDPNPQIENTLVGMMEKHAYDNRLGLIRRPDPARVRAPGRRPPAPPPDAHPP